MPMRILVDMDDVITELEKGFLDAWRQRHPEKPYIPLEQRTTPNLEDQYPSEVNAAVRSIMRMPGFFGSLEPVPGSIEALTEMVARGIGVYICTRSLTDFKHCVPEKYQWVHDHLGSEWVRKIICTKDKTLIRADILIDDKPVVSGVDVPSWEHVLYDRPYNRAETTKRRLTWENWKHVLL